MVVLLGHDHGHGNGHGHGHSHSDDDHSHHKEEHGHVHHHEHGHDSSITVTTHHHHHSSIGQQHDAEEPLLKCESDCESTLSGAKAAKKPRPNINVHSAYLHVLLGLHPEYQCCDWKGYYLVQSRVEDHRSHLHPDLLCDCTIHHNQDAAEHT
jgi:hypothetical protein